MSTWSDQMDRMLVVSNQTFGHVTSYQRPGYSAFCITGITEFLDRLEDVSTGQFYSVFYRLADFEAAPFTAQVNATFTGPPNVNGVLTFDGVGYTDVVTLTNGTPYQFLRGSSAQGAASNLAACINADAAAAGTFFSSSTPPHPSCSASWVDNGDGTATVTITALASGIDGNQLQASDQMTSVTLDSKAFYGGGPLVNDLVTILGALYRVSDVPEPDPEGSIQVRLEKKAV